MTKIEIDINPASESDESNLYGYAKYSAKRWASAIHFWRLYADHPQNKEVFDLTIFKLTEYINKEKLNSQYEFHRITYIGFPLDLEYSEFYPYFLLELNYGLDSVFVRFLVR